uniref:CSON000052 protein n=1 Tax=Culicoides sonorensis TaxID=179676 RepID=A0A336MDR2_CULSO
MSAIKENGIFYLQKLIKNVDVKLSTATQLKNEYQILCLVLKNDDLLLRYVSSSGETILKTIKHFENRRIQDVCFDDTGTWLLVLCYDNTIHVVPALFICDKSAKFKLIFSGSEISSFTVPFSPPHECPNPQSCPNQFDFGMADFNDFERFSTRTVLPSSGAGTSRGVGSNKVNEAIAANSLYNQFYCETGPSSSTAASQGSTANESFEAASNNNNNNNNENSLSINQSNSKGSTPIDSQILSSSLESSCICPYPKSCIWWQTNNGDQRAIIGYSEGTICIVRLTINCPFIGTCSVERGNIEQLVICRDNNSETVTLMINTSMSEQWKLLLEQKSIGYIYPDSYMNSKNNLQQQQQETNDNGLENSDENEPQSENWQFVVNLEKKDQQKTNDSTDEDESFERINADDPNLGSETVNDGRSDAGTLPKSISAAKARLQSLRDIGAKKIGTLKLKLAESRLKSKEREKSREQTASLALMETPSTTPEILTTPSGPFFIVQHTQDRHLLSALHSYSDTLSVHSMDISLIPLFLYKIPRNCRNLLLTKNLIYTIQTLVENHPKTDQFEVTPTNETTNDPITSTTVDDKEPMKKSSLASSTDIENVISTMSSQSHEEDDSNTNTINLYNGFGVVSCNMAITKLGCDAEFDDRAEISLYKFEDEHLINLHRMLTQAKEEADDQTLQDSLNSAKTGSETIISNYFNLKNDLKKPMFSTNFVSSDANVLQNKFPTVHFEQAFVITDKNVYSLELVEPPHIIFLKLVDQAAWSSCEEFCDIFNLSLSQCIEFAGDVLLRKKKVTKALLTYNVARIPPIKTALKLAMFGEVNALMHLCAMAIKNTFLLNSKYLIHPNMKYLVDTAHLRHLKYEVLVKNKNKASLKSVNTGKLCSDFSYETDEITSDLQMSSSSQFHLSNLLFLSLTERCVKDKNYIPLWNFIATNSKFHTSLASVVLSQSGLYSTAILLAMMRGACLDILAKNGISTCTI